MSGISVRVALNDLPGIAAGMAGRAQRIRRATALRVEADWKAGVRVDTGALRASIGVTADTATGVTVGTHTAYAPFEEYGTRAMPGSHARTRAIEKNRGPFLAAMRGVAGR